MMTLTVFRVKVCVTFNVKETEVGVYIVQNDQFTCFLALFTGIEGPV